MKGVGAFVTWWRTQMRRVFADCCVSGVVCARGLCNGAREALERAALEALDMRLSLAACAWRSSPRALVSALSP